MRHLSIDILRTVAIFMMVVVHFVENLSSMHGSSLSTSHPLAPWWLPSGLAAPLFTLLTGTSYAIWLGIQQARRSDEDLISKRTVRRGFFLIGLGFAFNVLVWLPEDTFNWDVLTLIGTAMVAFSVIRWLPMPIPLLMSAAIVATAPLLRELADYPAYWTNFYFDYDVTLTDVLLGYLVVGYFPVFPWLAYPIVGFVVGRQVFVPASPHEAIDRSPASLRLAAAGGLAVAASGCLMLITSISGDTTATTAVGGAFRPPGWTMFPASSVYVFGSLGVGMLLLAVLHAFLDESPGAPSGGHASRFLLPPALGTFFSVFSRHSLSIYLLHHIVHLWPLWIYGMATAGDPTASWQTIMPAWASLTLAILFFAGCFPLFNWLDRRGLPTAETWMRWLCD
jgi:uncharacterized membrane protein